MTIPIIILIILSFLALLLIFVRMGVDVKLPDYARSAAKECECGGSMTIGSREVQEDNFGVSETRHGVMAVLADGMGKHYGGKIASRIAVESFQELFQGYDAFHNPQYYFRKAFQTANKKILSQLDEGRGAASVAAVMIHERKMYYALAGDVKIAVYRKGDLVPVSSGHTIDKLAQEKFKEGKLTRQDAVALLEHHRLYNYVGQDGFRDIEFFDKPITLYGGEIVALMSDGLYDGVSWRSMEECLAQEGSCKEKALELVEFINRKQDDNKDNASVILLRVL